MTDPLIEAYAVDLRRRNLSARTIGDRTRFYYRFPPPLIDATTASIQEWLDTCNIGPRSRSAYLSAFSTFFQWAIDAGHRADDPTRTIRRPKLGRLLPRPISEPDLRYALAAADPRMLAAYQGLRCIEIAALRLEDLLFDQEPPLLVVRQGKGGRDGTVPLNPVVEEYLRAFGLPRSGFLFRLNDGRPIGARTLSAYVSRFLKSHGIMASAHRGRHHFGTQVYRLSGGDLRLTQEMLRHSSPVTTAIYADFDHRKAAEVVRRLGRTEEPVAVGD